MSKSGTQAGVAEGGYFQVKPTDRPIWHRFCDCAVTSLGETGLERVLLAPTLLHHVVVRWQDHI